MSKSKELSELQDSRMRTTICIGIFLVGVAISLRYAWTTNYLAVYDASRDYYLYNLYHVNPIWHPMEGLYSLQNTAIFSSYIPGVVQWLTHVPPKLFFEVWIAVFSSLVPVVSYLIAARFVGSKYAVFSALYTIGWVAFYQNGSFSRLNFAVLIYGLLVLVLLSQMQEQKRVALLVILSVLLPFAHYGGAAVGAAIIIGCLLWSAIKRQGKAVLYTSIVTVTLLLSLWTWQGVVNHQAWQYLSYLIQDTTLMTQQGVTADSISRNHDGQVHGSDNPANVMSRDRITQAALGVENPDNAGIFQLNRWLLIFAWVTVMLMLLGSWMIVRGDYAVLFKALVVFSLVAVCMTVVVPQVSRGYGIEKVYYQAIIVTGTCIVVAGKKIAKLIHAPAWTALSAVLVPYVGLMFKFGVIPSILG